MIVVTTSRMQELIRELIEARTDDTATKLKTKGWGGVSSLRSLHKSDIEYDINQLIAEYEEVTGESYTPKN